MKTKDKDFPAEVRRLDPDICGRYSDPSVLIVREPLGFNQDQLNQQAKAASKRLEKRLLGQGFKFD